VPFWLGAGAICLLLALGRYTLFYRLFYAVPYLDLIRCPVKFHHLVEICSAFLCGLGVEMWWRGADVAHADAGSGSTRVRAPGPAPLQGKQAVPAAQAGRRRASAAVAGEGGAPWIAIAGQRMAILAAVLAGALLLAAGIAAASSAEIAAHIARLGLGGYGEKLAGYTVENLVRAACLFGVAVLLFGLGRPRVGRSRPAVWLLAALALVLAVDLTTVAQRFMRPINIASFYERNPVVQSVLERGGPGAGVANYATSSDIYRDGFASALVRNGARLALPVAGEEHTTLAKVAKALEKRPEILWRTAHARFVAAPWPALNPLVQNRVVAPLQTFALDPRSGAVQAAQPAKDTFLLAEAVNGLPDVYVAGTWQGGLDEAGQLAALATAAWDPLHTAVSDAPATTSGTNGAPLLVGQAVVTRRRGSDFRLTTTVDVDTPQAGLLVLDENYAGDLMACVDGRPAPVRRANALWCAVEVPAGKHLVAVRRRPHVLPVLLSGVAGLALGLWALLRVVTGTRVPGATAMLGYAAKFRRVRRTSE